MSRRSRSAALLSAVGLLAGAAFSLAVAPSAVADTGGSLLLSFSPAQPVVGDVLRVSGIGCVDLTLGNSSAPAASGTDAATNAATAAATDPAAAPAVADKPGDDPSAAVTITVQLDGAFYGSDTATPADDGSWDGDNGIALGDAGHYTVDATCTPIAGAPGLPYPQQSFTVAAPPQQVDPSVLCTGCTGVAPGGSVSLAGTDFPALSTAVATLAGVSRSAPVDADGGFSGITFSISSTQAAGVLDGTIVAGATTTPFSVTVTAPTQPPGTVDGPVPTGPSSSAPAPAPAGGPADSDNGGFDGSTGGDPSETGTSTTSSVPTLPRTGSDSLWPGVIGALLVVTGGGLLWAGRRPEDGDVAAA